MCNHCSLSIGLSVMCGIHTFDLLVKFAHLLHQGGSEYLDSSYCFSLLQRSLERGEQEKKPANNNWSDVTLHRSLL